MYALWSWLGTCAPSTPPPQVRVEVGQRRHGNKELELTEEERRLRQQLEEEKMVSERIEQYLKKHYEVSGVSTPARPLECYTNTLNVA